MFEDFEKATKTPGQQPNDKDMQDFEKNFMGMFQNLASQLDKMEDDDDDEDIDDEQFMKMMQGMGMGMGMGNPGGPGQMPTEDEMK
jgi:soluble cytochrome b562